MRFLLAVMAVDGEADATPDEITEINAFNERLNANGQALLAIGLAGPRDAHVVDNRFDAGLITDGPAVIAEEYMAGIWLIEAADMN
ncbi:MAG: YciI family protein, partial [Ilumatobacteraceae bacterium]